MGSTDQGQGHVKSVQDGFLGVYLVMSEGVINSQQSDQTGLKTDNTQVILYRLRLSTILGLDISSS